MPNGMRWVGLDVHAHASAVAVFDDATGEVITRRVNGRPLEVLDVLRELPRPVRAVYEAGPTGYGLVRRARAEGIEMAVCSPGNIERRPGDRIKTRQARRDPSGAAVRRRRPAAGLDPERRTRAAA
jgi:transposase